MANATSKQGGPFIYAEAQNAAGQPDDTVSVSAHFVSRAESVIDDLVHHAELQHRAACWHKGHNVDLVDSRHGPDLSTAVNAASGFDADEYDDADILHPNLNDTTPAAPAGGLNAKWQSDTSSNVSAYVPFSGLGTVTAATNDKVVITDTSDSENPKRALVSDITALSAPVGSAFITVGADATLTAERSIAFGAGLQGADGGANSTYTISPANDLAALEALDATAGVLVKTGAEAYARRTIAPDVNLGIGVTNGSGASGNPSLKIDTANLSAATVAAADSVIIHDADDSLPKLAALSGMAAALNAVTQAANTVTSNTIGVGTSGAKTLTESSLKFSSSTLEDTAAAKMTVRQTSGQNLDLGRASQTSTIYGSTVSIGDSGSATTCNGTLANGAHTTTVASATAAEQYGVDSTKGPWSKMIVKDFLSSGGGAGQTVYDLALPTNFSGTIHVRFTAAQASDAAKRYQFVSYIGVGHDAGGGYVKDIEDVRINNDVTGAGYALTSAISTSNLRFTLNDAALVSQCALYVTLDHRNTTA